MINNTSEERSKIIESEIKESKISNHRVFNYSGDTMVLYEYNQKKVKLGIEIAKILPGNISC